MSHLLLPTVTLCAVASVNVEATIRALRSCLDKAEFAGCLLFTDAAVSPANDIRVIPISKIRSAAEYSDFLLRNLVDHVESSHCLVVQWDGFILDAGAWDPMFLEYDFIGAPWPQFTDGQEVGNGGFSLRSRKLLVACCDAQFHRGHPEDVAICRTNRSLLEQEHGIRFADWATAERFSFERTRPSRATFGFHGIFNMIPEIGADEFWDIYRSLDDRGTARTDFRLIMRQLSAGPHSLRRRMRFAIDYLSKALVRPPHARPSYVPQGTGRAP